MRQRITILNPGSSNDDIVDDINRKTVKFQNTKGFLVENRLRYIDSSRAPLVRHLRVQQSLGTPPSQLFNYHYPNGVHVYAVPQLESIDQKDEFFDQVSMLLNKNFGLPLDRDLFIETYNSVYYHTTSPITPKLNLLTHSVLGGTTFEWLWSAGQTTFKELTTADESFEVLTEEDITKEIGLFIFDDKITTTDDLFLSGLRVELVNEHSEDEFIHKTMFHVKPRHRIAPATSNSTITPNGLHPVLHTNINSEKIQDFVGEDNTPNHCKFYYYLDLTRLFIFDKYQSIPEGALLVVHNGKSDLELPEYSVSEWGSEVLLEFDTAPTEVSLTLHSRYQKPGPGGQVEKTNSAPQLFYACDSTKDAHLLATSPFDNKLPLGGNYEAYFTNDTVFYHYANTHEDFSAQIPHGSSSFERTEMWTVLTLAVGVLYLLVKMIPRRKLEEKPKKE